MITEQRKRELIELAAWNKALSNIGERFRLQRLGLAASCLVLSGLLTVLGLKGILMAQEAQLLTGDLTWYVIGTAVVGSLVTSPIIARYMPRIDARAEKALEEERDRVLLGWIEEGRL